MSTQFLVMVARTEAMGAEKTLITHRAQRRAGAPVRPEDRPLRSVGLPISPRDEPV